MLKLLEQLGRQAVPSPLTTKGLEQVPQVVEELQLLQYSIEHASAMHEPADTL